MGLVETLPGGSADTLPHKASKKPKMGRTNQHPLRNDWQLHVWFSVAVIARVTSTLDSLLCSLIAKNDSEAFS